MATVNIYDSEGYTYSNRQSEAEGDSRIRNFFFAGVRLSLDLSRGAEIIAFFRARESKTGRTEQYYAQYQTQTFDHEILREFKQAVEDRASELGLTVTTSNKDVQVFRELDQDIGRPPGDNFDRNLIEQLFGQRQRVKVGVSSYTNALALLKALNAENARKVAIADDAQQDVLSDYDLAIEQGNYRGIEPIGKTKSLFDTARDDYEDSYIEQKLESIKADVDEIQDNTSIGQGELERRLKQSIPVLSSARSKPSSSAKTSSFGSSSTSRLGSQSLPQRILSSISTGKLILFVSILLLATGTGGILYLLVL